jgi:hypothetical protein
MSQAKIALSLKPSELTAIQQVVQLLGDDDCSRAKGGLGCGDL